MSYLYNSRSGFVINNLLIPGQEFIYLHSGTGWHGPFDSKDAVNKYYSDNHAKNPGWKAPTDYTGSIDNLPDAVKDQTTAAVKGVGLSDDELRTWLIRIGEILLGIVLVGVGVAKLTGTTNLISSAVKAKL